MILYLGDDQKLLDFLYQNYQEFVTHYPSIQTFIDLENRQTHAYKVIILDGCETVSDAALKRLSEEVSQHFTIVVADVSDEKSLLRINSQMVHPNFYFRSSELTLLKNKIDFFRLNCGRLQDKESPLYIAGVEDFFDYKSQTNKSLEERYMDHIGTFIMILDPETKVRYINNMGAAILGLPKEEIIGKKFVENFIPKDFEKEVVNVAESLMESEKVKITHYINPIKNAKGEERLISWTNSSLVRDDGTPVALLTSGIDITQQRATEKELMDMRKRQQTLLNALPQNIFMKDKSFNFYAVNEAMARNVDMDTEDIIGKSDFDIFSEDIAQQFRTADEKIISTKVSFSGEESFHTKDRRDKRTLYVLKRPVIAENGEVEGIIGISWDITEEKKNERFLLRQRRLAQMGEMLSIIAHQWRQPLTTINAIVAKIKLVSQLGTLDCGHLESDMESIEKQIIFLSETINDFRNFFKPDKSKEKTNVKKMLDKTLKIIGNSLEIEEITLDKKLTTQADISTYESELIQVLLNLFHNSIDVLKERNIPRPMIRVYSYLQDHEIVIEFCDNGGGIDERSIERIWEPYFSTKTEKQGTGLGLYMTRQIIEEHCQGSIEALNNEEGACILIRLPLDS